MSGPVDVAKPKGTAMGADPALRIEHVGKHFGALRVLENVDAVVQRGKITAFIGPNGAGKTTLFHTISGDIVPDAGEVELAGCNITRVAPWRIARLGLGRLFQDVRVFRALSCEQNVLVALHGRVKQTQPYLAAVCGGAARQARLRSTALDLLSVVGLENQAEALAGTLSFGNQKLLAFARLLAGDFKVLLLDEPASGISTLTLERISRIIRRVVADNGTTVVMIEHNMHFVSDLADTTYVMKDGTIYDHGPTAEVLARPANRELCMGMFSPIPSSPRQSNVLEPTSTVFEVSALTAGYRGQPVLEKLDLRLFDGDRVALIGPNGCGKSTLLKAVTGVIRRASGKLRLRGKPLEDLSTDGIIKSGIGYLKQTRNIFPGLTVDENLLLAHMDGRSDWTPRLANVKATFPMLKGLAGKRAGLLSGGERQALALAMVLMRRVDLLLLDEPVSGLSPENAASLLGALDALQRAEGFAFVLVEHRLRAVSSWVNRVLIMTRGQIVEDTRDTSILTDRVRLERHYQL